MNLHLPRRRLLLITAAMLAKLVIALVILTVLPHPAHADVKSEHAEELKRIQEYLSGLTTIVADFTQVAPNGELSGGKFFLKRPGKMRWQYDPPTPVLMIANDNQMTYYDYELEQVSHIPIDSTLAGFLAREVIDLSDTFVKIENFRAGAGMVRVTLSAADKPEAGKIMLELSDSPLQLRSMVVTDAKGQTTTVALQNAQFGVKLDDKLFIFKDPRKK